MIYYVCSPAPIEVDLEEMLADDAIIRVEIIGAQTAMIQCQPGEIERIAGDFTLVYAESLEELNNLMGAG